MQASRRTLLASSADGFSPVLYLRGPDARLFDLEERRLRPPKARAAGRGGRDGELPPALRTLLQGPFSLILGEAWDDEATVEVRARCARGCSRRSRARSRPRPPAPLFSLAQRYALQGGRLKLDRLFQKILHAVHSRHDAPAIIDAFARTCGPACTRRCCGCRCSSTRSPAITPTSRST
jgi:hypothetical protein